MAVVVREKHIVALLHVEDQHALLAYAKGPPPELPHPSHPGWNHRHPEHGSTLVFCAGCLQNHFSGEDWDGLSEGCMSGWHYHGLNGDEACLCCGSDSFGVIGDKQASA